MLPEEVKKYVNYLLKDLPIPWEQKGSPWKNKSQFLNYIRGGIRRGLWEKYPLKLNFIKDNRKRIKNPHTCPRCKPTVWGAECNICKKTFAQSKLQVDHIREDFNVMEDVYDILKFIVGLLYVDQKSLQLVCKPCHQTISLAQRRGISLEEATRAKQVIAFSKLPAAKQKSWFTGKGYKASEIANASLRVSIYEKHLGDVKTK